VGILTLFFSHSDFCSIVKLSSCSLLYLVYKEFILSSFSLASAAAVAFSSSDNDLPPEDSDAS